MFKQHLGERSDGKNRGPAPVPADDLAASLAPFGQSRMLPRAAYVDPEVFEWEQANIFSGWMCVGRATDIAEPGDQKAVATGQGGVLVVRDESGEVHAFANVCRHRGHELLPCGAGAVNKKAMFTRSILTRLALVTVVALGCAFFVRPDGYGVFGGLAFFQMLMLGGASVPVYRQLHS